MPSRLPQNSPSNISESRFPRACSVARGRPGWLVPNECRRCVGNATAGAVGILTGMIGGTVLPGYADLARIRAGVMSLPRHVERSAQCGRRRFPEPQRVGHGKSPSFQSECDCGPSPWSLRSSRDARIAGEAFPRAGEEAVCWGIPVDMETMVDQQSCPVGAAANPLRSSMLTQTELRRGMA